MIRRIFRVKWEILCFLQAKTGNSRQDNHGIYIFNIVAVSQI
jgi:hypothetical protein